MDYGEMEDEQEELKGIVALLLGLAALAELLVLMPLALRTLLLPVLRHAEFVAGTFAVDCAERSLAFPPSLVLPVDDDSCAEALRLARCLRALAAIIGFFGASQGFFGEQRPLRGRPNRRLPLRAPAMAWRSHAAKTHRAIAGPAVRFDTS
jgi:hypothetical protein